MDTRFFVYALMDPTTMQPFYIGKGSGNRPYDHFKETENTTLNPRKFAKIQKIIANGGMPQIQIIERDLTEENAFSKERELILRYGRKGYEPEGILTNLVIDAKPPNRLGQPHSQETKDKMRMAALNRVRTPEHCRNISISKSGERHPLWGKPVPLDRIEKIRKANKGKRRSEQTKRNMAVAHAIEYEVTKPDGKSQILNSVQLKELCAYHQFNKTAFVNASRTTGMYKGWRIQKL